MALRAGGYAHVRGGRVCLSDRGGAAAASGHLCAHDVNAGHIRKQKLAVGYLVDEPVGRLVYGHTRRQRAGDQLRVGPSRLDNKRPGDAADLLDRESGVNLDFQIPWFSESHGGQTASAAARRPASACGERRRFVTPIIVFCDTPYI